MARHRLRGEHLSRERIEKELEEILERAGRRRRRFGAAWFRKPRRPGGAGDAKTSWLIALATLLLVTALFVRSMIVPLALAGVVLLLLGFWLAMRTRGQAPVPVRHVERLITPIRLLIAALIALMLGLLLRRWFVYLGALAFVLFIWAYWISWPRRGSGRPGGRRWRGEVVDYPESLWDRIRRWFRR